MVYTQYILFCIDDVDNVIVKDFFF